MNRIILIGNGFDLAHGLETSYHHFIDNYWGKVASSLKHSEEGTYSDSFFDIYYDDRQQINDTDSEKKDNIFFDIDIKKIPFENIKERLLSNDINYTFKNRFLEIISNNYSYKKWVDIEKEYYQALKDCLKTDYSFNIEKLNNDFSNIRLLLIEYLANIQLLAHLYKSDIFNKIVSEFRFRDFTQTYKKQYIQDKIKYISSIVNSEDDPLTESDENIKREFENRERINQRGIKRILNMPVSTDCFPDLLLNNLLIVNFNYTSTPELYKQEIYEYNKSFHKLHDNQPFINTEDIYIHGKLNNDNNPIIFGFGDEIDEDYSRIENLDDNRFLENIKSMKYHETANYKRLLEYIDSDYFQIYIFGSVI